MKFYLLFLSHTKYIRCENESLIDRNDLHGIYRAQK